jgi:hypothetical protein
MCATLSLSLSMYVYMVACMTVDMVCEVLLYLSAVFVSERVCVCAFVLIDMVFLKTCMHGSTSRVFLSVYVYAYMHVHSTHCLISGLDTYVCAHTSVRAVILTHMSIARD